MIKHYWFELENKYNNIKLHEYIIMPNHFHGTIQITDIITVGADLCVCPDNYVDVCPDNYVDVCPDNS